MNRRQLLATGASCTVASFSSGCAGIADRNWLSGTGSCTRPVEEFSGEDRQYKQERYSELRLNLNKENFTPGETLEMSLRNEGGSAVRTGGRDRFDIQAKNGSTWESILCATGDDGEEVQLAADSSFDWALELSTAELVADTPSLTVNVDEIRPRTYRFVYCGLAPAELAEDNSGFWTLIWRQFEIGSTG